MKKRNPCGALFLAPLCGALVLMMVAECRFFSAAAIGAQEIPDELRQQTLRFVRQLAETGLPVQEIPSWMKPLNHHGPWAAAVTLYRQGEIRGKGQAADPLFFSALEKATKAAMPASTEGLDLRNSRFLISVTSPKHRPIALIEWHGKAEELAGNVTAVRVLDKALIFRQIEAGKQYLLRVMHPEKHGFYKKYDVLRDDFGNRLRTIYSASSLLTLLKISDVDSDKAIAGVTPRIAEFLLSMQCQDQATHGAFYYAYYLDSQTKQNKFVVGTTSKAIFTLLELYRRNQDPRYLEAARSAGDWLLTMLNPDGSVINQVKDHNGQWVYDKRYSCLYTGQVLSALSRLYRTTLDPRYYTAAEMIARLTIKRARAQKYFMKDDYRYPEDPVPTSWVVMSLLDFYKIKRDAAAGHTLFKSARVLLKRQYRNPDDLVNFGRFKGTEATSGNGWIGEVLGEVYALGREEKKKDLEAFKNALLRLIRWLIQNTYSEKNMFFLKTPAKAIGGLIRNPHEESVRTDAVCHGINGYLNIWQELNEGPLLTVPEK
ncbi:MAG: glycoside hydrolase family 76 protein [Candidatus Omnitrophica bacterium]|nr:glycoside hydrolase family 76 protein [Candidatus Omnitrophota bacterium]